MRNNTGTSRATVHTSKCHRPRDGTRSRLQAQIHTVFSYGASIVGWRLPGQVSPFRTLWTRMNTSTHTLIGQTPQTLLMRIAEGAPGNPGIQVLNAATSEKAPLPQELMPHTRNLYAFPGCNSTFWTLGADGALDF